MQNEKVLNENTRKIVLALLCTKPTGYCNSELQFVVKRRANEFEMIEIMAVIG